MNHGNHINTPHNQNEPGNPVEKIGLLITTGALIAWCLGVSTNGVFNFFSDSPSFQIYPFCFTFCGGVAWITVQIVIRQKNIPWLFMVASAICVAFFVATTKAIERKEGKVAEMRLPKVDLMIGPVLDGKKPFGTTFIIKNAGQVSIKGVWANAYWGSGKLMVHGVAALNPIPELKSGGQWGLHFARYPHLPPFRPITFINIEINFKQEGVPGETNAIFQFCLRQNTIGDYVWIPAGEGQSMKAISDAMNKEDYRMIDAVPFLDIHINAVEDVSQTNKDYPIKFDYSWRNIGGQPATDVYIEWAAMKKDNSPYMIWNHHGLGIHEMLWPGMTNETSRIYTEGPNHDVFAGITTGSLTLIGVVLFKDVHSHEYAMQVSAIRTNSLFEIRNVGLGGYFTELQRTFENTRGPVPARTK
jgi:hypothetical protein